MVADRDICDVPEKGSQEAVLFGTGQGVMHGIASLSHTRRASVNEYFPHPSLLTAGRQVRSFRSVGNVSIFTLIVVKFQGLKVP